MTDRIDHLAEAQGLLSFAVSDQAETSSKPKDVFDMATTRAQVHATLALVEQQRIANLIALSHDHRFLKEQVAEDSAEALTVHKPHDQGGYFELRPEIARALGVEQ